MEQNNDDSIINQFIDTVLLDQATYKGSIQTVLDAIKGGNEDIFFTLVDSIQLILTEFENLNYKPETYLQALRAIKDLMHLKDEKIALKISEDLLPYLEEIARYKKESTDENRGRTYFGNQNEYFVIGSGVLNLSLECIMVWASWYPHTKFQQIYEKLISEKIKFPTTLAYFKHDEYIKKEIDKKENNLIKSSTPIGNLNIENEIQNEHIVFKENQEGLIELLCQNEREIEEKIKKIIKIFDDEKKIYNNLMEKLMNSGNETLEEKFTDILLDQIDFVNTVVDTYTIYQNKKIDYDHFRKKIANLYSNNKYAKKILETEKETINKNDLVLEEKNQSKLQSSYFNSSKNSPGLNENHQNKKQPIEIEIITNELFLDMNSFNKNKKEYLSKITLSHKDFVENILIKIKDILEHKNIAPLSKILALRFLKECVDTKLHNVVYFVEDNIVDILAEICKFNCNDKKSNDRGRKYFFKDPNEKNEELEKLSLTYFLQALESILVWAKWFPMSFKNRNKPSYFLIKYQELVRIGITFPEWLTYFDDEQLCLETFTKILEELKFKMKEELILNENNLNKKNILAIIKDFYKLLSSKKIEKSVIRLESSKDESKKQIFQEFDFKLSFIKNTIVNYEKWQKDEIKYTDFRNIFFEEIEKRVEIPFQEHKAIIKEKLILHGKEENINDNDEEFYVENEIHINKASSPLKASALESNSPYGKILIDDDTLLFMETVCKNYDLFYKNAYKYIINCENHPEIYKAFDYILENEEESFFTKYLCLLFIKQLMDIRFVYNIIDENYSNKILHNYLIAKEKLKDIHYKDKNDANEFIKLAKECFAVWNYWKEQQQNNKKRNNNYNFCAIHSKYFSQEDQLDNFEYFDNNSNNFKCQFCLFHRDFEYYNFILIQSTKNFIDFIQNAIELDFDFHEKFKNYLQSFEDILSHYENFDNLDSEIENHINLYLECLDQDKNYQEQTISFEELLHIILQYYFKLIDESPIIELEKDKNSATYKIETIKTDNLNCSMSSVAFENQEKTEFQPLLKNSVVSRDYKQNNDVFNSKTGSNIKNNELSKFHVEQEKQAKPFNIEDLEKHPFSEKNNQTSSKPPIFNNSKDFKKIAHPFEASSATLHKSNNHEPIIEHRADKNYKPDLKIEISNNNDKKYEIELKKNNELNELLEEMKLREISKEKEIIKLKHELEKEKYNHSSTTNQNDELLKSHEHLNRKLKENTNNQKTIEELESTKEKLSKKLERLNEEFEDYKSEYNHKKSQKLIGEIKELKIENDKLNQEIKQNQSLKDENNELFKEIKDLKNTIEELKKGIKLTNTTNPQFNNFDSPPQSKNLEEIYPLSMNNNLNQNINIQNLPEDNFEESENSQNSPYLDAKDISPLDKQLIFPFKNPIDYFSNKTFKEYKGKLITYNKNLFSHLTSLNIDENKFKLACLKKKQSILNDGFLQIGTVIENQLYKDKNFLKMGIFFTNKSQSNINRISINFLENLGLSLYNNNSISHEQELIPDSQLKREIIMEYNIIPYENLLLNIQYRIEDHEKTQNIILPTPTSPIHFMRWIKLNLQQFKTKWKQNSRTRNVKIYKTKNITLNTKIAKSINSFKNYFPLIVDLKPNLEKEYIKKTISYSLGGAFYFSDLKEEYLIKIVLFPNDTFLIRIIGIKDDENQAKIKEFIMQNFLFVFASIN